MFDFGEVRKGLAAARPFVLSHHLPADRDRCYAPSVFGREVHLCARCTGIYPGIAAGLLAYGSGSAGVPLLLAIALLPLPALLDWTATSFADHRGFNVVRTLTGAALGVGYGLGLAALVHEGRLAVLAIGVAYALVAGVLLVVHEP